MKTWAVCAGAAWGWDINALTPYVDVFSPMPYHGPFREIAGIRPAITSNTSATTTPSTPNRAVTRNAGRLCRRKMTRAYHPAEFEQVLRYGLGGRSGGVMMFTIGSVAQDAEKMAVMQRVYREMTAES